MSRDKGVDFRRLVAMHRNVLSETFGEYAYAQLRKNGMRDKEARELTQTYVDSLVLLYENGVMGPTLYDINRSDALSLVNVPHEGTA